MKTFILLSLAWTNVVALEPSKLSVIIPTAKPTVTSDIWQCALSTYTQFFNPPKPTGALLSAIDSYGLELLGGCRGLSCPYPDATRWCGFTTAAPTAVLPAYTSYASSASVWWANHSSSAIDLATECPNYWYRALNKMPTNGGWLNQTIINAECFAGPLEAQLSSSKKTSASATPSSISSAVTSPLKASSVASASSSVATSSASKKISTESKRLPFQALVAAASLLLVS